jgi:hypothetical protein
MTVLTSYSLQRIKPGLAGQMMYELKITNLTWSLTMMNNSFAL